MDWGMFDVSNECDNKGAVYVRPGYHPTNLHCGCCGGRQLLLQPSPSIRPQLAWSEVELLHTYQPYHMMTTSGDSCCMRDIVVSLHIWCCAVLL
jgi:hypothetical protein